MSSCGTTRGGLLVRVLRSAAAYGFSGAGALPREDRRAGEGGRTYGSCDAARWKDVVSARADGSPVEIRLGDFGGEVDRLRLRPLVGVAMGVSGRTGMEKTVMFWSLNAGIGSSVDVVTMLGTSLGMTAILSLHIDSMCACCRANALNPLDQRYLPCYYAPCLRES
jgi:hypothetical protein